MALSFYDPLLTSRLLDQNFGVGITPDDVVVPTYNIYNNSNYFRPWKVHVQNAIQDFGSAICNEKDKFKISLDVQQFRPNELVVKTTKTDIIVEGKHEEREDEHGYISRQFTRKYKLPDNCDSESVISNLTKDGVLIITASKKCLKNCNEFVRIVPIKMCETCPKLTSPSSQVKVEAKSDIVQKKENFTTKNMAIEEKSINQNKIQSIKDDHSRLINTDGSLKLTMQETSDKMISGSKMKACDDILQMATGSYDKINVGGKTELSGYSSMSSETMQSKESSFSSSMSYGMKATSDKTSEYLNEMITTELKQAAENV